MLKDTQLYTKIGRICTMLSERLNISPAHAFDMFYSSNTCSLLHDERSLLYLMGDLYIVNNVIAEQRNNNEDYHSA